MRHAKRGVSVWLALALCTAAEAGAAEEPATSISPAPAASPTLSRTADGSLRIDHASLEDALRLAQGWIDSGQPALAEQLLAQIAPLWPEDARIPLLRGLAAKAQGDQRAAVEHFRDTIDIAPDADRARYELANAYAALEDWDQAQFHYRFVLGSDAPTPVKADVASRLIAIGDRRRWSASFEAALAPSGNINVAPSDATIDPIFNADNPAVLSGDSTAQSGLGVHASNAAIRLIPLTRLDADDRRVRAEIGASAAIVDYDEAFFDDASASVVAGINVRGGNSAIGASIRTVRRWYANDPYEDAVIAGLSLERRIAAPLTFRVEASAAARDNQKREDYDGAHYRAAGQLRLSLSGSSFLSAEAGVSRFDTEAKSTSYSDMEVGMGAYRDLRRGFSLSGGASLSAREHDGPDPFFRRTREDTRWSLSTSVIKRDLSILGFAPFVRYRFIDNSSNLKLYSFEQHSAEFGFTAVF